MGELVKDRTCGDCTLCCLIFDISEFPEKNVGEWCKHCKPGQGCGIYEDRPLSCSGFRCLWLRGVGAEEDRPDRIGVVFSFAPWDDKNQFLRAGVDPDRPWAWHDTRPKAMIDKWSEKWAIVVSVHGVTDLIVNGRRVG
jgi:hypothetical protein